MLRTYGPACDGSLVETEHGETIPETVTWIDLEEPTHKEEQAVEKLLGIAIPTRDDMVEIEPSSRLYEEGGVLFMTLSTLCGVEDGMPTTDPIAFVLTANRLVTVRYASPKPVRAFSQDVRRRPDLARDALTVLMRLLDAIVDRTADELERSGAEMEALSRKIFADKEDERRIPAKNLTALLSRIGRAQSLLGRVRETNVSTLRLLSFLGGSERMQQPDAQGARAHLASLQTDVTALLDHAGYLGDDLTFQLDASLGLISIEQNAAMKLFSWMAVVFLPPTLIAGIFGMNFEYMPELKDPYGYPLSLVLMLLSAVVPLMILKRRGWI
ncbi:magnesium transporter CorA family protein [Sphingomonas rosea]|uniref:Magnesium transporter CorA family protein n=1 Tax=Sphingomonas rosea TaxID=335605 RepID=A0ABP7TQS6_9SPHN